MTTGASADAGALALPREGHRSSAIVQPFQLRHFGRIFNQRLASSVARLKLLLTKDGRMGELLDSCNRAWQEINPRQNEHDMKTLLRPETRQISSYR